MRRILTVALAGLLVASVGITAPVHAAPGKARTVELTPQQFFTQMPVSPRLFVGYRGTEQFIPKSVANKKDKNGCNLRQRMIIQLADKKPKVGKKCKMTGGRWLVDGGTRTVTKPADLVISPIMSFKDAWGSGAYAWTPAQRLAWATNATTPRGGTRSKAVTLQQTTQALFSKSTLSELRNYLTEIKWNSAKRDFIQYLADQCGPLDIMCFARVSAIAQAMLGNESYFELDDQLSRNRATETCRLLSQYAANVRAWGLAISPEEHAAMGGDLADQCNYIVNVRFTELFPVYDINPVTSPTAVPSTSDVSGNQTSAGITNAPFSGYAAPVTAPVSASQFGLIAPVDWGTPGVPTGYLRLWDSTVSWRDIEVSKGTYDWSKLDATVGMASSIGASIMYVLGNTPSWANGGRGPNVPPTNLADAANFISAVCNRYTGSIRSYQVWNEGNLTTFWTGSQDQLGELTALVNGAVKGCFPSAQVIAASTGTRASGPFATNFPQYLDALASRGWPVDGYSVHTYPAANGGPSERVNELAQFKTMLALKGAPVRPIYDTELNYGLAGLGQDRVAVDPARGAAYLATSFIQSVQYGVESTVWFLWTQSDYDKLGIQLNPGTPTTITAWRTIHSWLVGSRMQRCTVNGSLHACQITSAAGANETLLWTEGDVMTVDVKGLGTSFCSLDGSCGATNGPVVVGISPVRIF
jgi:hypothetical protein